jgi:hypothetical protein
LTTWLDFAGRNPRFSALYSFCGAQGEQRVREAYGQNYERLVALKQKHDPINFFRINQNIEPAKAGIETPG